MDTAQAEALLIALRAEEAELLHAADAARQTTPVAPGEERIAASDPPVEPAQVQQLKRRWRTLVCPTGDTDTLTAQWKAFKVRVCGRWFSDSAMCSAQYTQLALALDQLSSPDAPSLTPPSPRQPPSAPIRQAPRLAVSSPHR
jgi:hypothetical protein